MMMEYLWSSWCICDMAYDRWWFIMMTAMMMIAMMVHDSYDVWSMMDHDDHDDDVRWWLVMDDDYDDDHLIMPLELWYEPIFPDRGDEQISWSTNGVPSSSATAFTSFFQPIVGEMFRGRDVLVRGSSPWGGACCQLSSMTKGEIVGQAKSCMDCLSLVLSLMSTKSLSGSWCQLCLWLWSLFVALSLV